MTRVGTTGIDQNIQRTESILMYEKKLFWYIFRYKLYENTACAVIRNR